MKITNAKITKIMQGAGVEKASKQNGNEGFVSQFWTEDGKVYVAFISAKGRNYQREQAEICRAAIEAAGYVVETDYTQGGTHFVVSA